MQKANVVEAQTRHKRVLDEHPARGRQPVFLLVVPHNAQDLAAGNVNCDAIRDFQTGRLALPLVFKASNVQFAVALINLAVAVLMVHHRVGHTLLCVLLFLGGVELRLHGLGQGNVTVRANDLHPLHNGRAHHDAVRDALGAVQISSRVVNDQVFSVNALRHRAVAERAEVNLLEAVTAKANHEQHTVSVRVILRRRDCQVVVHVLLKRSRQFIKLYARVIAAIPDLDGTVSGQKFRAGICLKTQYSLKQKRMANLAHAFDGCAIACTLHARKLNLEAQKLQALSAILKPV